MVIPLTWDEDGIMECAFAARAFYRGKAVDQLQMHLKDGMGFSAELSPVPPSPVLEDELPGMESEGTYRIVTVCFDGERDGNKSITIPFGKQDCTVFRKVMSTDDYVTSDVMWRARRFPWQEWPSRHDTPHNI